jgi:hypothetical protein
VAQVVAVTVIISNWITTDRSEGLKVPMRHFQNRQHAQPAVHTQPPSTFGVLHNKDTLLMLLRNLPLRMSLVSKTFSQCVQVVLKSAQLPLDLQRFSTTMYRRILIAPPREPKVDATIIPTTVSFGEWPLVRVVWLHDWGTLFEEYTVYYDITTGARVKNAHGVENVLLSLHLGVVLMHYNASSLKVQLPKNNCAVTESIYWIL